MSGKQAASDEEATEPVEPWIVASVPQLGMKALVSDSLPDASSQRSVPTPVPSAFSTRRSMNPALGSLNATPHP